MGMDKKLKQYAVEFARMGGSTKSERKSNASRINGKKGGRPKKEKEWNHDSVQKEKPVVQPFI